MSNVNTSRAILLGLIAFLASSTNLFSQKLADNNFLPDEQAINAAISWDKMTFDFGEIPQGKPVEAAFKLTNNGTEAFLVTDVKRTCGCTATGYSQEPILPGESTTITATYNAKKEGHFNKIIKVSTSLGQDPIPLKLKGKVVKAKH